MGHYIWECEVINKYIRTGKCKCSTNGKVVLTSGVMVLCSIMGAWLHDHIDEWHQLNPGQMATQMLFEVLAIAPVLLKDAVDQSKCSCPMKPMGQHSKKMPIGVFALN